MVFVKKVNNRYIVCIRHYTRNSGAVKPTEMIRVVLFAKHVGKYGTWINVGGIHIVLPKELIGKKVRLFLEEAEEDAVTITQYCKL